MCYKIINTIKNGLIKHFLTIIILKKQEFTKNSQINLLKILTNGQKNNIMIKDRKNIVAVYINRY